MAPLSSGAPAKGVPILGRVLAACLPRNSALTFNTFVSPLADSLAMSEPSESCHRIRRRKKLEGPMLTSMAVSLENFERDGGLGVGDGRADLVEIRVLISVVAIDNSVVSWLLASWTVEESAERIDEVDDEVVRDQDKTVEDVRSEVSTDFFTAVDLADDAT